MLRSGASLRRRNESYGRLVSLSDVIGSTVAIATFALAFVTWRMAVATRRVAEDSEAQLGLLRRSVAAAEAANQLGERQATAAEAANAATDRHIATTSTPKLFVERYSGDQAWGRFQSPNTCRLGLVNQGAAPAIVEEAYIGFPPQRLFLVGERGNVVPVGERLALGNDSPVPPTDGDPGSTTFTLSVTYAGPTGDRWNMQADLRVADFHFVVIGAERHKNAGPAPRS
jgi:hypothetical protein